MCLIDGVTYPCGFRRIEFVAPIRVLAFGRFEPVTSCARERTKERTGAEREQGESEQSEKEGKRARENARAASHRVNERNSMSDRSHVSSDARSTLPRYHRQKDGKDVEGWKQRDGREERVGESLLSFLYSLQRFSLFKDTDSDPRGKILPGRFTRHARATPSLAPPGRAIKYLNTVSRQRRYAGPDALND